MNIKILKKRMITHTICMIFLVTLIFANFFIINEAEHICMGDNCTICVQINSVQRILKQSSLEVPDLFSIVPIIYLFMTLTALKSILYILPLLTPITKKIRMNN